MAYGRTVRRDNNVVANEYISCDVIVYLVGGFVWECNVFYFRSFWGCEQATAGSLCVELWR